MPTRRDFLKLTGLGATALMAPSWARAAEGARRPNILFILMDDMGWMDSTVYGSQYYRTPNMERLAKRGMVFTQAYAANPFCSPTRASILTGKYPARLGITTPACHLPPLPPDQPLFAKEAPATQEVVCPESQRVLPLEERTLAELLRDNGYRTAFIGKWHLGQPEAYWPPAQGFEINIGGGQWPAPPSYFSPYHIRTISDGPQGEYLTDRLTDEACRYLEQHRSEPFFLCLWHYAVHMPLQAKEEITQTYRSLQDPRGKQNNPLMASMLQSMDESLGRVLDTLDRLNLTDNTLLVFFSDNGGNEYDRVGPEQWMPTNNDPLRSGKGSLYEGGTRVPLLVSWPGKVPAGSRCDQIVTSVDFYPTLCEAAGVKPDPGAVLDGVSILPALLGTGTIDREAIFCHFPHVSRAKSGMITQPGTWVRKGDWKLIRFYQTSEEFPNRRELYNLREDLGETRNLADQYPEKVKELDALIDGFLKRTGALVPIPNPAYDPLALAQLQGWRAFGGPIHRAPGVLQLVSRGNDPQIACADVPAESGALALRFRMKSDSSGIGQIFWADSATPQFGPTVRLDFKPVHDNQWHEYEVPFTTRGVLQQLRIDPSTAPGTIEFEWVKLCRSDGTVAKTWDFSQSTAR